MTTTGDMKGDARRLDCSSYRLVFGGGKNWGAGSMKGWLNWVRVWGLYGFGLYCTVWSHAKRESYGKEHGD